MMNTKHSSLFLVLIIAGVAVAAAAVSPNDQPQSVRAFVDVGAQLDAAFDEHLGQWTALLDQIKLSDTHTSGSGFDVDLSNLDLHDFQLGAVTTSGAASGVFSFSISGVGAALDLNFHVREQSWPHIKDSGSAHATFNGGSISGQVVLAVNAGSLQLTVQSASCSLNNFNLEVHSSLSWLYDLIKGLIEGSIKDSAQDALSDAIKSAIPEYANPFLQSLPKSVPLHIGYSQVKIADLVLDTSILAVNGQQEDFVLSTSAMPKDASSVCPFPAQFVGNAALKEGSLATVAVDEAIFNCFAWDVYNQGHLQYLLTEDNFKQQILPLHTTAWKDYAPPMFAKYPNNSMQILARSSAIPSLSISQGPTVNVSIPLYLDVSVIDNVTHAVTPAFTLMANLTGSANGLQAHVENQYYINITALVADGGCVMSLFSSEVGKFDTTNLASLFDFGTKIGLTYVGSILSEGWTVKVPLPPPLVMTVAGIDAEQGYLRVYAATAPPSKAEKKEQFVF